MSRIKKVLAALRKKGCDPQPYGDDWLAYCPCCQTPDKRKPGDQKMLLVHKEGAFENVTPEDFEP